MCRYAQHPVKTHLACLPCRYSVKAWPRDTAQPCPRCRRPMVDEGRDFKAPRHADVRGWRKVALLNEAGLFFDSCGCSGPGARPRTVADAKSVLGPRRKGSAPRKTRLARYGEFWTPARRA